MSRNHSCVEQANLRLVTLAHRKRLRTRSSYVTGIDLFVDAGAASF
jgi:hypothetical protein